MLKAIRQGLTQDLRTVVVAVVAASVVAGPAAVAAVYVANADKVDNKHAVSAGANVQTRKGKLVATNRTTGRLPDNIIAKAPNANLLDGKDSAAFLPATGKAGNADKLDGLDSGDVLPGGVLPAGATVRGAYNNFGRSAGGDYDGAGEGISFGYQLTSPPVVEKVLAGAASTQNCPGTDTNPQAAPGYLCIYESNSQNKRDSSYPVVGWGWIGNATQPFGAYIYTQSSTAAGFFWSRGSWAVTAP